jgi:cytochrome c556
MRSRRLTAELEFGSTDAPTLEEVAAVIFYTSLKMQLSQGKEKRMVHRKGLLVGAIALSASLFVASQVVAQSEVIEKRQKVMKQQSADVKEIKAAAESKDFATIETKAKDLVGTSSQIPSVFPKGSTKGKTKATAAIWDKRDEFEEKAKDLNKAASELAAAAKKKDESAVEAKIKAVSSACGSCHKAFRADKYSE